MTRAAPPWLEDFQARFSSVLRTPLDRATGTLRATLDRYDPHMVEGTLDGVSATSAERLAVYNRQYWFRLFEVLHAAFPLTCRLVGYWAFNAYAARYLEIHPPRGWDVDAVGDGFAAFFTSELDDASSEERVALAEGATIDACFRELFRAPPVTPFRPSAEDAPRVLDAHLNESPAVAIVEEHSALLHLRKKVLLDTTERRVSFPPLLPKPRSVALVRTDAGTKEVPLEAREAELLRLLRHCSVREALGRLEEACPLAERAELPEKTRVWLAHSVERGFWSGMRFGA